MGALFAWAVLLSLFTCSASWAADTAKTVLVLFDMSGSIKSRDVYRDNFSKVMERVKPGDAVVAGKITGVSLGQASFPVAEEFPGMSLLFDNERKFKKAQKARHEKVSQAVDQFLKSDESAGATEIMSALHLADQVFKKYKRDNNVLIIFSDMLEDSSWYNFNKTNLDEATISGIIKKERAAGRLPGLRAVKVYVAGAAAPNSRKMLDVQKFWLRYMAECGADMKKENYGEPFRLEE